MTAYIVKELNDINSYCKGEMIEARNLTEAKRKASRMQIFQGTVMQLSYLNGHVVSVKDGKWIDQRL